MNITTPIWFCPSREELVVNRRPTTRGEPLIEAVNMLAYFNNVETISLRQAETELLDGTFWLPRLRGIAELLSEARRRSFGEFVSNPQNEIGCKRRNVERTEVFSDYRLDEVYDANWRAVVRFNHDPQGRLRTEPQAYVRLFATGDYRQARLLLISALEASLRSEFSWRRHLQQNERFGLVIHGGELVIRLEPKLQFRFDLEPVWVDTKQYYFLVAHVELLPQ